MIVLADFGAGKQWVAGACTELASVHEPGFSRQSPDAGPRVCRPRGWIFPKSQTFNLDPQPLKLKPPHSP